MGHAGAATACRFRVDWIALAARHASNATVIGFDLRDEPSSLGKIV